MQIDAPDARKTAFCTPRQRCGIPCLCKNGSITSFSGFPISYERRRRRRILSIYYMSAVGDFRRDTTVGLLFGGEKTSFRARSGFWGEKTKAESHFPLGSNSPFFIRYPAWFPSPEGASKPGIIQSIWWGKLDSNQRSHGQQIYSLPPLAAREFPHIVC